MPKSKRPCAMCAKMLQVGKTSLPAPICNPCRRARLAGRTCPECGSCDVARWATYCSKQCSNVRTSRLRGKGFGSRGGMKKDPYTRRASAIAGLNEKARRRMLATWRRQRRSCTYCPALVEQVDHVIPLARGGTNYEGNLQPICAAHNARKGKRLHIEFIVMLRAQRGAGGIDRNRVA